MDRSTEAQSKSNCDLKHVGSGHTTGGNRRRSDEKAAVPLVEWNRSAPPRGREPWRQDARGLKRRARRRGEERQERSGIDLGGGRNPGNRDRCGTVVFATAIELGARTTMARQRSLPGAIETGTALAQRQRQAEEEAQSNSHRVKVTSQAGVGQPYLSLFWAAAIFFM